MRFATQDQMSSGYYGTYNTVKEIIINKVQKKYEYGCNMAQAIRTGKAFDINSVKPVRGQSTKTDPEARQHEQGGMDIMYQEELCMYLDRKKHLNNNPIKVYSLIISNYCTKQMKTRVEEHPKFETKSLTTRLHCWKTSKF